MVLNCSDLLNDNTAENPFTDRDFTLLTGAIQPRNDGQRFWYVANSGDNNKFCLYDRDISDNELQKNSGTFLGPTVKAQKISVTPDLDLPIGVAIMVLSAQYHIDHDPLPEGVPAQYPQRNTDDGVQDVTSSDRFGFSNRQLARHFPHLGFSQTSVHQGYELYGLNTTQADANSFYTSLTRLHANGHFKYFNDQAKRLYIRGTSTLGDTLELYLISDDFFLINKKPAFMSHGIPQGAIITDGRHDTSQPGQEIDIDRLRTESVFFWFRFRFTIQPQ